MDDPGPTAAFLRSFPETADGPVRPHSPRLEPLLSSAGEDIDGVPDETLYAILNVPKDASEAEIRDRYRSLATTYHPDRQRDDQSRLAAHGRFTEIQRAYEILTDDTKRTIYDLFGEEGLKTTWEIGPRNRTKEEMRSEFQRQAYEKRQLDAEALVKPKGDINLVLDARAVFVPPTAFRNPTAISHTPWARIQRVRPGQIVMKHSFETAVGEKTQLQVMGQMASRNGAGGGNVVGTIRHQFSQKFWVEGGTGLLSPRVMTGKGTYTVDENTSVNNVPLRMLLTDMQIRDGECYTTDSACPADNIGHPRSSLVRSNNRIDQYVPLILTLVYADSDHSFQIWILDTRSMGQIPPRGASQIRSFSSIRRFDDCRT